MKGGSLHELVGRTLDNPIVNLTMTGLGGSALEPGVPATDEMLSMLPDLIDAFHGEAFRIRWRFDPLLKGFTTLETFERIASRAAALGVLTCTFSFPAYFSLKGDLSPLFDRANIPKWTATEKTVFLKAMVDIAKPLGIRLLTCTQPTSAAVDPWISPAQCIPKDVLERGHPEHAPLSLEKDASQRSKCLCIQSEDIGDYETDRCRGGCAYCYSKAGGPLLDEISKGQLRLFE